MTNVDELDLPELNITDPEKARASPPDDGPLREVLKVHVWQG